MSPPLARGRWREGIGSSLADEPAVARKISWQLERQSDMACASVARMTNDGRRPTA